MPTLVRHFNGAFFIAFLVCIASGAVSSWAQPVPGMFGRPFGRGAIFRGDVALPQSPAAGDDDSQFADGPALKTDQDAQQLLTRAEQFVNDGRLDLAAVLWQKVLDDAGDNLVSVDGRLYISLRRQVEQRLINLPPLALQTYRVTADGEAQALLSAAGPEGEEEALAAVVRRFFMSSHGDDAAYKLGCLALDRYDFISASRFFAKVLEEYPEPSMPRPELLLRLAVAAGRIGDAQGATKYLEQIEAAQGARPPRSLVSLVAEDIKHPAIDGQVAAHRSTMPALPADATAKTLTELWSHEYPLLFNEHALNAAMFGMVDGRSRSGQKTQVSREEVIQRWQQNGWVPSGKLLFADDRVYFKTNSDLSCWRIAGESLEPIWRSAWHNEFAADEYSQQMTLMAMSMGVQADASRQPRSPAEIFMFGDQIAQDMSIHDGKIYSIEGRRVQSSDLGNAPAGQHRQINFQATPRRARVNWLAAYDLRTGKAKWHRGADEEVKEGAEGGLGFMAAPVPCGNLLLAPVTDGGSTWLYALSPQDGRTVWKTYLCDEPPGGCNPWSPVAVAVAGRDAYVLPGAGVVFAIDGTSGAMRWVVRYPRDVKTSASNTPRNMYGRAPNTKEFDGWNSDTLVAAGRHLLVMASDSAEILALDCRSGDFLWKSPRTPTALPAASYCVGVQGRGLFVAGQDTVRRIDIVTGKLVWTEDIESSLGRAVLTDDAVYVPVNDSVAKLDLDSGTKLQQVGVRIASEDPTGNLYSDGEKLWVLSANRVYSVTHLEYRMQALQSRIEQGDAQAALERAGLLVKDDKWEAALTDLRRAYALLKKQHDASTAAEGIFAELERLNIPVQQPLQALAVLTALFNQEGAELSPEAKHKLKGLLNASLSAMPRVKTPGVAARVLAAESLLESPELVESAARVVTTVAGPADKRLLAAAAAGRPPASLIAAEAWAIIAPEEARPVLKRWLADDDLRVKLVTVRALLQSGDTSAIEPLIEMLEHDDRTTRVRAYQTLRAATGKQVLPFTAYAPDEERKKQVDAWRAWYAQQGKTLELTLPLPPTGAQLGRLLAFSHGRSLVVELDGNGKELSRRNMAQPWSGLGLADGNRLIAATTQARIVEYDHEWKEKWTVQGLPSSPWSVDRTADGTTLVACPDAAQVLEISADKDKKVLWRGDGSGQPVFVKRLENGHTLVCLRGENKVIEVDSTGKEVWQSSTLVNPYSAQRLENGNTLVAAMVHGGNGLIVELDPKGRQAKVIKQGLRQLYAAERLPSGNLLYADGLGIHEVSIGGKSVWSRRDIGGVTGFSAF
jgi:outer membrane protein assembly factor BamB